MPGPFFAYLGPESMLPLTSTVAAVVGVFMMFGRNTFQWMRRLILAHLLRFRGMSPPAQPHFRVKSRSRSHTNPERGIPSRRPDTTRRGGK